MDTSIPDELIGALEVLVLWRSGEKAGLEVMGAPPDWVQFLGHQVSTGWNPSQLVEQSRFLKELLPSANKFWDGNDSGELALGRWEEITPNGEICDLEAKALCIGTSKLLLITRRDPEIRSRVQRAREASLKHSKEVVARKRREAVLEERLRESERTRDDLLVILDQLPVGTLTIDTDGQVTFVNEWGQRVLGKARLEILGRRWDRVFPFSKQALDALSDMGCRPAARRKKVPIQLDRANEPGISLQVDVRDDPRDSNRKIFFVYEATESALCASSLGTPSPVS